MKKVSTRTCTHTCIQNNKTMTNRKNTYNTNYDNFTKQDNWSIATTWLCLGKISLKLLIFSTHYSNSNIHFIISIHFSDYMKLIFLSVKTIMRKHMTVPLYLAMKNASIFKAVLRKLTLTILIMSTNTLFTVK